MSSPGCPSSALALPPPGGEARSTAGAPPVTGWVKGIPEGAGSSTWELYARPRLLTHLCPRYSRYCVLIPTWPCDYSLTGLDEGAGAYGYQAFPQPRSKSNSLTTVLCDLPHMQVRTRKTSGDQQPIHNRQKYQSRERGAHPHTPRPFPFPAHSAWDPSTPHTGKLPAGRDHRDQSRSFHGGGADSLHLRDPQSSGRLMGLSPGFHGARCILERTQREAWTHNPHPDTLSLCQPGLLVPTTHRQFFEKPRASFYSMFLGTTPAIWGLH